MIKIICLLFFDEDEKFNFDEIKVDTDIGQIARETKGEEEKKENDPEPKVTPSNEDE